MRPKWVLKAKWEMCKRRITQHDLRCKLGVSDARISGIFSARHTTPEIKDRILQAIQELMAERKEE